MSKASGSIPVVDVFGTVPQSLLIAT